MNKSIYRTVDVNFNRSREGLRVCEDIARFTLNDKHSSRRLKALRHEIEEILKKDPAIRKRLLSSRDSIHDVGRASSSSELDKKNVKSLFEANLERSKEAVRVLEEFFKLIDKSGSEKFKNIRFRLYNLEKGSVEKLEALRNIR